MLAKCGVKVFLSTAACAAPCGFLAWPFHESVWRGELSGYFWYSGLPGPVVFFGLALLSLGALRLSPRAKIAIVFSLLVFVGACERQSYEREKVQAECESEGITDCGSRMYGPPSLGWPVILSPFLALLYLRKSGKVTSQVIASALGFKVRCVLTIAGMIAILGMLAWHAEGALGKIVWLDGDFYGALLAFPAMFLAVIALRVIPGLFPVMILSMAAFAGVSVRHSYELAKILAECHRCDSSALPRVAEYGWPVICVPFLAFAFVKLGQRLQLVSE